MGEKTGLIHSRRVWQSRINLAMLHRLKEQRKKRQNSDVMLKKLGMIDVLPTMQLWMAVTTNNIDTNQRHGVKLLQTNV